MKFRLLSELFEVEVFLQNLKLSQKILKLIFQNMLFSYNRQKHRQSATLAVTIFH